MVADLWKCLLVLTAHVLDDPWSLSATPAADGGRPDSF